MSWLWWVTEHIIGRVCVEWNSHDGQIYTVNIRLLFLNNNKQSIDKNSKWNRSKKLYQFYEIRFCTLIYVDIFIFEEDLLLSYFKHVQQLRIFIQFWSRNSNNKKQTNTNTKINQEEDESIVSIYSSSSPSSMPSTQNNC